MTIQLYVVYNETTHEANLRYSRAFNPVERTPHYQRVVLATWHDIVLMAQERVANPPSGSPLAAHICTKHFIGPNLAVFRGFRRSYA